MLTRRAMLGQASAVASAAWVMRAGSAVAAAGRTAVDFAVPRGACDCHVHVFGDPAAFPFAERRVYTPPQASVEQLLELQRDLHLDRVVVVQPSVYGADNACTLDAVRRMGARARGIAGHRQDHLAQGAGGDGERGHPWRAAQSRNQYRGTVRSSRCQSRPRRHCRANPRTGLARPDLYPHRRRRGAEGSPGADAVSGGGRPFRPRQSEPKARVTRTSRRC